MTRRAVTLVEMLVAMGIVALLTAVLIVSLRGVRSQATDLQNLSNMRATLVDFVAWSVDHGGVMLNAGLPDSQDGSWYYNGETDLVLRRHFYLAQSIQWPRVLHRWLDATHEHWHATRGPNDLDGDIDLEELADAGQSQWAPSRFAYSATMLAAPESWTYPGRGWTLDSFAERFERVAMERIRAPSQKGILTYYNAAASEGRMVSFFDGSASFHADADLQAPGANPQAIPPTVRGRPVFDTLDGCRGVDR
ncbi:MAG: type II secretion system protein [Phycisphaerales bacterium]|nr:type II secretion system protein [Phycisphaerales bacterium]